MFVDTHCHLHAPEFEDDTEKIVQRAIQNYVSPLITIGTDLLSSVKSLQLADQFAIVYAAVGIHPNDLQHIVDSDLDKIDALARRKKSVAIGEIGLDYYRHTAAKDKQLSFFRRQVQLARKLKLPAIVHNREAHQDLYNILIEEKIQEVGGVLHSFSGDDAFLKSVLKLNLYISFTGAITYKNTSYYKLIDRVPLEQLLLETDSPYLAPVPFRGKRNEPSYIKYIAATIARIKNISVERLAEITTANAQSLFRIDAS
jgi:TatD DNase family protein